MYNYIRDNTVRTRCARIRARKPSRPDPWQQAVALYLEAAMAGRPPRQIAEEGRLLARSRRVLEDAGLEADPGALTRADMLWLHVRRARMPGDGGGVLAALGRLLGWWGGQEGLSHLSSS